MTLAPRVEVFGPQAFPDSLASSAQGIPLQQLPRLPLVFPERR